MDDVKIQEYAEAMTEPHCCREYGCRRKQPIEVQRGGLSGVWYAITRYKRRGTVIEAREKHELHPMVSAALDVAQRHMDEVVALHDQQQADRAAHRASSAAHPAGERPPEED